MHTFFTQVYSIIIPENNKNVHTQIKLLMSYAGIVPREHSSGGKRQLGRITKTGNAHVRFEIVESSWHYRHDPRIGEKLRKRQEGLSPEVQAISWKAQNRLNKKFRQMAVSGKPRQVAAVAVGRELLGFIWAVAMQASKENENKGIA